MRLIPWLTLLLACTGPGEDTDTDPPDPVLPRAGYWEVESFEWEVVDCEDEPHRTDSLTAIFVATPDDRLHVTYGPDWVFWGTRCPVESTGDFSCPVRTTEYNGQGFSTESVIGFSGSILDETSIRARYSVATECVGERCQTDFCHQLEHVDLVWVSEDYER